MLLGPGQGAVRLRAGRPSLRAALQRIGDPTNVPVRALYDGVKLAHAPDYDALGADCDTRADLQEALKGLSERERMLLAMRYEEDLTQPAIAARLGIPEGTVKVQLHRARDKLRRAYVS